MVSNGTSVYWTNTVGNLTIGGTVNTIPGKSISSNDALYLASGSSASIIFKRSDTIYIQLDTNNNFRPETTNQIHLGDSTHRWKGLFLEGQSSATSEGIQFYSGTTLYARIGADTTTGGLGIYGSAHLWFKPSLSDATLGFEVDSTAVYPTTTQKHSLGKTDKLWTTIYSNSLVSTYLNINTAAQTAYNVYVNGTSYFNGNVTHKGNVIINNAADEPIISFKGSNNTNAWGSFGMARNTPGDGDLYSDHRFRFLNYSYDSNDNSYLSYYECFDLPAVNADRVDNASYNILTTKYTVTTAQGGTGNTSYTASRILYTSSATQFSSGTLVTDGSYLSRAGVSKSWIDGRDNAIIKTTSYSGYDAILSMKTTNGAWELGVYTSNKMYFTYTPDSNYNASNNTGYVRVSIASDGTVTAPAFSGSFSGNATSATKATQDGNGNTITSYYCTLSTNQTITGTKTFNSYIYLANSAWINVASQGIYSSVNSAHWYPNSVSSYGTWVMQGSKGGYTGIHFGNSTGYMTIMDQGTYKGLYQEGVAWILCYNKSNNNVGIGNSSCSYKMHVSGDVYADGGWLRTNGSRGWYNESYSGGMYMTDTTYVRVYNNKRLYNSNTSDYSMYCDGGFATSRSSGVIFYGYYGGWKYCIYNHGNANVSVSAFGGGLYLGYYNTTSIDFLSGKASINSSGYLTAVRVYNAVWNDYAECRAVETNEAGYCVTETPSGRMIKTTERLQAGCKVTSDTYGTCMGKTMSARTPIAVAGRVLVYPYRNKNEYSLGAAVCSAPNGTVDIMTREEIMMYPERIIGTVSEIPNYEFWHGGSKKSPTDIKVNGRIWIYVR